MAFVPIAVHDLYCTDHRTRRQFAPPLPRFVPVFVQLGWREAGVEVDPFADAGRPRAVLFAFLASEDECDLDQRF